MVDPGARLQSPAQVSPRTVLVVDDCPAHRCALSGILERAGYRAVTARGGEEGLALAERCKPDLIFLDIGMSPGIDGYETLMRLKSADLGDIPVIFLSSHKEAEEKVFGLRLGAVDFVTKPFHTKEVLARAETHLTILGLRTRLTQRNTDLQAANIRMKNGLEAAGRVQRGLLPDSVPDCKGYEFGWAYRPCDELGGDSLDIFKIDDDTIGFYILDVSGHGVPASLLAITVTRSLALRSDSSSIVMEPEHGARLARAVRPGEVLRRLNVMNPMQPKRNPHFFTMIYGLLQCSTGRVRYACAGHPGPIVVRARGDIAVMEDGSIPIGVLPDTEYEDLEFQLGPGDRFFLHSDGLHEQRGLSGEEFGTGRVRRLLSGGNEPVGQSIERAVSRVTEWAVSGELSDDVSVLGLRRAS